MFNQPFHVFDNHNASLSEGGGLPVVVPGFSETPHGPRGSTDFPHPMRQSAARLPLACPHLARRDGAPHERGAGGLRAWLSLWPAPGEVVLLDMVRATDPLGQVTRPVVHQDTPAFEQDRAGIGCLYPVPDHMRQGRLDHLSGMIRLQLFGNTGHGPVPRRRGDESEQEPGSPNGRGMFDDFRLWGSSRCRRMGVTLSEGGGGDIEG